MGKERKEKSRKRPPKEEKEMMDKLYLAHPEWTSKGIREWEKEAGIKVKFLNPFSLSGEDISKLEGGKVSAVDYHKSLDPKNICERDISLIESSDGVLAIISPWHSYGTHMEIVYAKILQKPVYSIVLRERDKYHPWIIEHSKKVFTSKHAFTAWAKKKWK